MLSAGIERHPPVGVRLNEIGAPHLVGDIPLRRKRKIVVADLREIALLPLGAVDERDVVQLEGQQRIRLGEIGNHDFRALFGSVTTFAIRVFDQRS